MASANSSTNMYAMLEKLDINVEEKEVDSTSPEDDDYEIQDNEYVVPGEDSEDEDPDLETMTERFDLLALEEAQEHKPIFTRDLLQRIASDMALIQTEQRKPISERTRSSLIYSQPGSTPVTIWEAATTADTVQIHYTTRVETSPSFRTLFDPVWERSQTVRTLNPTMTDDDFTKSARPYHFTSFAKAHCTSHLDAKLMDRWRARLQRTQQLWAKSAACAQLCSIICGGAGKLKAPVTKIVCLGLGRLDLAPHWYQSALQHMTVFSLAESLSELNRTRDPGCPAVEIIAQDPCYTELDHILLRELCGSSHVEFGLSDPETLLAVDKNTLVVSAFLPVRVPLVQILADLFGGQMKEGPAMVLADNMEDLRKERRWYAMTDRPSPAVARWLLDGYLRWEKEFVGLEDALAKDVGEGKYWLKDMSLWLRRD
jgi:hypothetical protein